MANDKWSGSNPWLGLAPYTEGTPLYGRTKESIQLADIIKDYTASVVFGKSGIGKSSLLSAGISPLLREENYIPVRIRLVHNTEVSYIEQIESKVRETVHCIDRFLPDVSNLGLWDFFHRHSFTTENGIDSIPVIILDQFEEIYTLTDADHKKDIITFFNELSSLLNDIKPDNVIEEERKHSAVQSDSDSATPATPKRGIIKRSAASALNYTSATTFRFVICLREDKLYLLERNSANIPSLKANRYNLQALSPESALEVIMCPRPELFSNEEATNIVDKLADMGDEGLQTVDPAILSLFLYKYYEKKGEANYDNIFADYYQEATKDIKGKSIAFLEDHLLTLGGYRNQVPLDDALSSGVTQEDIQSLLCSIIIRKEQRKGIDYIEFSHDRICEEAKRHRELRKIKERNDAARRKVVKVAFIIVIFISFIFILFLLYDYEDKNHRIEEEKRQIGNQLESAKDSLLKIQSEISKMEVFKFSLQSGIDSLNREVHKFQIDIEQHQAKNVELEEENNLTKHSLQVKTKENVDLIEKNQQLTEENLTLRQKVERQYSTGVSKAVVFSDEQKNIITSGTVGVDNSIKHNETGPTINK